MAAARHIEQRLIEAGYSRSRLEKGNYALREAGVLQSAGRGPHAPQIWFAETASILLAYAASGSSARALDRLRKLEGLRATKRGPTLLETMQNLIETGAPFRELLVSRIRRRARFVDTDGIEIVFAPPAAKSADDRAENWWSIKPPLLHALAAVLRGEQVVSSQPDEPEEVE